jgi:hypothetical protein
MAGPSQDWLALAGQALGHEPMPAAAPMGAPPPPPAIPAAPLTNPFTEAGKGMVQRAGSAAGSFIDRIASRMPDMYNLPGPSDVLGRGQEPTTPPPPAGEPVAEPSGGEPPMPAAAQPVAAGPAGAGAGAPMPSDVQFRAVSAPGRPAGEATVVGPQQRAHLLGQFDPLEQAGAEAGFRSQALAAEEAAMFEREAESAQARQEASERVQLRRQQELEVRQREFDATVNDLAKQQVDSGRYWASQSTGEKIGWTIAAVLGGFGHGGQGRNIGFDSLMANIDEDVALQRETYQRGLDFAKNQQTAFGMALDRFHSEDAAAAVARTAALDTAQMRVNQMAAQWKGAEAANQAQMLGAQLAAEREKTMAAFLRFVPAAGGGTRYQMAVRGDVLPGTVSEKEAQRLMIEHGTKPAEKMDEHTYQAGLDVIKERAKGEAKGQADKKALVVRLPNGEEVEAPTAGDAKELREASEAVEKTKRLVAEAKKIRSGWAFRAPLTQDRRRLQQIQADLVTHFGVQNKLGALSEADMELARAGTAELFDVGSGVESALDRLNETSVAQLTNRVKTYGDASPRARGQMPASLKLEP